MKNSHEWVNVYTNSPRYTIDMLVKEVQEEAYNQAIEDAAKNVNQVALNHVSISFLKQSILKLKL